MIKKIIKLLFKTKSTIIRIKDNDVLCIILKENKNIQVEDIEYFCIHLKNLIHIPVVFLNECELKVIRKVNKEINLKRNRVDSSFSKNELIKNLTGKTPFEIDPEKYIEELR